MRLEIGQLYYHYPIWRFDAFVVRSKGHNDPYDDILLVLGKAEAELKVAYFLTNMGVNVYAVDLTA